MTIVDLTRDVPRPDTLSLTALGAAPGASRWRTEAMRSHRSPRLLIIGKGHGRITVAGLTSGYGPNNLIFLPAGTLYGFELGPTVFAQMLTIPRAMASDWPEEPRHMRLRDVVAQKELALLLDGLERELRDDSPAARKAAHHRAALLAVFVERQLEFSERESRRESAAARLAAAYADLVDRDFAKGLAVADFARALGVTPTHLSRVCRQCSGRSAHGLLTERIMTEARRQLRGTDRPVSEIAGDLGFQSAAYFSRAFRAQTGQTPTGFRKSRTPEVF